MEEERYITFVPVGCPECGRVILFKNENGEHEFKCSCGFEDVLTIEDAEEE